MEAPMPKVIKDKKIALIAKIKENTWQNKQTLELFGIDLKITS